MTLRFVVSLILLIPAEAASEQKLGRQTPSWVRQHTETKASKVSVQDQAFLASWLKENARPAGDYLIDLYKKHQLVIVGEAHNIKEHKDFVLDLIPRLYNEAGVRIIGLEICSSSFNSKLTKLVTAEKFDREAMLNVARAQAYYSWNSKEHWDFVEGKGRGNVAARR